MKQIIIMVVAAMMATINVTAQNNKDTVQVYIPIEHLPRLVEIMPAPPAFDSPEFASDVVRYCWGKQQRRDSARVAMAIADAEWESHEKVYGRWAEAFGMAINERETPEIWKLVETSLATTDPMRKEPKAAHQRLRPFEYYDETMPSHEEPFLRGEGSFPSGHSLRGWTLTMLLAQIAPERAAAIYRRGREYCDSRVIVGAHWQSDVDAGRNYACVGYIALQNNEAFQKQMRKAKEEYRKVRNEK
jgi:acid phosphatase (class A)